VDLSGRGQERILGHVEPASELPQGAADGSGQARHHQGRGSALLRHRAGRPGQPRHLVRRDDLGDHRDHEGHRDRAETLVRQGVSMRTSTTEAQSSCK
jgi:hypothetical protein